MRGYRARLARRRAGRYRFGWQRAAVRAVVDHAFDPARTPLVLVNIERRTNARNRLNEIGRVLTEEETAILLDLLFDFRDRLDGRYVAWIGWPLSRLRNKDHLRGIAIGKVTSLLNRIAKAYGRD